MKGGGNMNITGIGGSNGSVINETGRVEYRDIIENDIAPESPLKKNRDEYIPAEEDKAIGLYRPTEDENGMPYIDYDAPEKKESTGKCTANTDRVDREIKELKEKAEQLNRQLRTASEDRRDEIEKQLEEVKRQLSLKDNDSYRRENAVFS